jgi:hypothetical protein
MRAPLLLLLAALVACGGAEQDPEESQDVTTPRNQFTLTNAPVPSAHPTALVYLPRGFDPDDHLNLVVHYHGWTNCIANDGEASNARCSKGGAVRTSHHLISQMDASGVNAALVLIEIHFDQATSDDGQLAQPGFFRAMIDELLPHIGALARRDYSEDDLDGIVLTSHSGGYQALAHTLDRGGLTQHVKQVILLDSVYGFSSTFESWATSALGKHRLAVVYTDGAGTEANAQRMANDAKSWGTSAGAILDDRTFATQPDAAFEAPIVFKRSALSHDGTAQYYFGKLLAHAGLQ